MPDGLSDKQLFLNALRRPSAERAAYLDHACPDPVQRARIQELLRHHQASGSSAVRGDGGDLSELSRLGDFRVLRKLGEGGMGVVYLAEDVNLGRKVALKVLHRRLTDSPEALLRFRAEARNAAGLKHPFIVPVFSIGYDEGEHFIVSEYVDGETLADYISTHRSRQDQSPSISEFRSQYQRTVEIVACLAEALEYSHNAGVIHRDVKPSNVLIDRRGQPCLTDFGIAKNVLQSAGTRSTDLIGSCHYMSPEQAAIASVKVDRRSDVFSLGVVLYEMLSFRRPFDGPDIPQVLRAVTECKPRRLRHLDNRIPKPLETICHRAMEREPVRRYQSAAELQSDLQRFLDGKPILATPPGIFRRTGVWLAERRRPLVAVGVLTMTVIVGALAHRLRQASLADLACVSIESDLRGCTYSLVRMDPQTLLPKAQPESVGQSPSGALRLARGQYRLTVQTPDRAHFLEIDLVLSVAGDKLCPRIRVHGDGENTPHWVEAEGSSTLHAAFPCISNPLEDDLVEIPAGSYPVGDAAGQTLLTAHRLVDLPAFEIDRTEVSNGEYREFVEATGHRPPPAWGRYGFDEALRNRPVVEVSFEDAQAYARWRGMRLPTMIEWQAATRGLAGRRFPWGNDIIDAPCPMDAPSHALEASQTRDEAELFLNYVRGTVDCDSSDGCIGTEYLAGSFGNVREYTATLTTDLREVIVHGRSWIDAPRHTDLSTVWVYPLQSLSFKQGFRCARSVAPAQCPK